MKMSWSIVDKMKRHLQILTQERNGCLENSTAQQGPLYLCSDATFQTRRDRESIINQEGQKK
jgi:hypothetical protein